MKNQHAKFTCSTESTLTVSLYQGKANLKVSVRQRTPGERTKVGCKHYFDLGQDTDAQAAFDQLVKDAVNGGWVASGRAERGTAAFQVVPPAPGAKKSEAMGGSTVASRAAVAAVGARR